MGRKEHREDLRELRNAAQAYCGALVSRLVVALVVTVVAILAATAQSATAATGPRACGHVSSRSASPVKVTAVHGIDCTHALALVRTYLNDPPEAPQGSGGFVTIGAWSCSSASGTDFQNTGHAGQCEAKGGAFVSIDAASHPTSLSVVPARAYGSMTLGYRPFDSTFESWHGRSPFNSPEELYLTVGVAGVMGESGTLHVTIRGLGCPMHCTSQHWAGRIRPLSDLGVARLTLETKSWGCGRPVISAWVTGPGGRTPLQNWAPPTGCAE